MFLGELSLQYNVTIYMNLYIHTLQLLIIVVVAVVVICCMVLRHFK